MRVFMFKALALTFIAATADAVALDSKTTEATSQSTSQKWTFSEVDRYHPGEFTTAAPNSFAALHADEWYGNKDQKKNDLKEPPKPDPKKEQRKKEEQKKKDDEKKKKDALKNGGGKGGKKDAKKKDKKKDNGNKSKLGPESNHKNKVPPAKELNNTNKPQSQITAQEMEKRYFNEIEQAVKKNKGSVFMYVQSGCPYCNQAKELLRSKNIPFVAVDLNDRADAKDFMNSLKKKARRDTVPLVYVNQKLIGGFKELSDMNQKGTLKKATEPPKPKPDSKEDLQKKKKNAEKQKINDLKDGKLDPKNLKEGSTIENLKMASKENQDVQAVKKMIEKEIKENSIVVFSRTDCQECIKVKDLLQKDKIVHRVIDVDKSQFDTGVISKVLLEKTGQNSVPQVFANEMYIGGYAEVQALEKSGQLDAVKNDPKYKGPTSPQIPQGKSSSDIKKEQQQKDQEKADKAKKDEAKKNAGKPGNKNAGKP